MGIPTIDLILMVDHREQSAFLFDILDALMVLSIIQSC
jgi:hypothetical protein